MGPIRGGVGDGGGGVEGAGEEWGAGMGVEPCRAERPNLVRALWGCYYSVLCTLASFTMPPPLSSPLTNIIDHQQHPQGMRDAIASLEVKLKTMGEGQEEIPQLSITPDLSPGKSLISAVGPSHSRPMSARPMSARRRSEPNLGIIPEEWKRKGLGEEVRRVCRPPSEARMCRWTERVDD